MTCVHGRPIGCRCGSCRPDLGRVTVAAAANNGGPRGPSRWLYRCAVCRELFTIEVPDGHVPPKAPQTCTDCIPVEIVP